MLFIPSICKSLHLLAPNSQSFPPPWQPPLCLGVHAKLLQSCPTLWDRMDCMVPGSSIHWTSRQKYWSGLPFPPPGNLPDPEIEPASFTSPALAGGFFTTSAMCEALYVCESEQMVISCLWHSPVPLDDCPGQLFWALTPVWLFLLLEPSCFLHWVPSLEPKENSKRVGQRRSWPGLGVGTWLPSLHPTDQDPGVWPYLTAVQAGTCQLPLGLGKGLEMVSTSSASACIRPWETQSGRSQETWPLLLTCWVPLNHHNHSELSSISEGCHCHLPCTCLLLIFSHQVVSDSVRPHGR